MIAFYGRISAKFDIVPKSIGIQEFKLVRIRYLGVWDVGKKG